jgi:GLPGLI family protein
MKFLIQVLLLLIVKLNINAQVCFKVEYEFFKMSPNTGGQTNQPAVLYYEDGKSLFIHSKGNKEGMIFKNPDGSDSDGSFSGDRMVVNGWYEDTVGVLFMKDFNKKTIGLREFFWGHAYITEERISQLRWEIMADKKTIGQFNCNMAKAKFRGRNYTVWYTSDIPISDGPWKLTGLPGLILEATEDRNEFKFVFKSITYPCKNKQEIKLPKVGKVVDLSTYRKSDAIESEAYTRKWQSYDFGRDANVKINTPKKTYLEIKYEE